MRFEQIGWQARLARRSLTMDAPSWSGSVVPG